MKRNTYILFFYIIYLILFGTNAVSSINYNCLERGKINADRNRNSNRKFRIIHNNDGSDLLGNYWFGQRPLSVADIDSCVDMVAHSQVTTYMICTGSDFLYVPSKYGHVIGDDLDGKLDCGCNIESLANFKKYYQNHLNLAKEGTDLVRATLTRAKKNGLETFINYRMNDLHFNDTTTRCPIKYSEFWIKHPEYWLNDATQGYNSAGALDFTYPEVREQKLNIITEQLERYWDIIDGLDLDFMRFIVFFKSGEGPSKAHLLTSLLKDVRKRVDEISARKGKKILLSARVAPTVEGNLRKGIDIREWLRLNLLDFVSTGVHWRGDPSMPVDKFKEELGEDLNIPFYASIDDGGFKPRETWSHGQYRGMASHILSQGADGLYLFNYYFGNYMAKYNKKLHIEEGGQVCRVIAPDLLNELGSLKTLKKRNKIYALSDSVVQYEIYQNTPLPLYLKNGIRKSASLYIGDNVEKEYPKEAILFFRTMGNSSSYVLKVNGKPITIEKPEYTKLYDMERGLGENESEHAFILPGKVLQHGYNVFEFQSLDDKQVRVIRLEVALKYGDVATHGYF